MNKKIVTISVIVILSVAMVVLLNIFFSPPSADGEAMEMGMATDEGHDDSMVEPALAAETGHEAEEDEYGHETEPAAQMEAEAGHGDEAEPAHAEAEGGHHGESGIGYIGLDTIEPIEEHESAEFVERTKEEAYAKADLDEVRFIIFGALFVLVFLSFARIKGLSKKLSTAIDWYTIGTVTGLILLVLVIPSGIIITLFYMPTSTGVLGSVNDMAGNGFLAFWRNMHNWSSEVFILLMLIHAARTISTNTYMGNRKFIWLTGGLLFIAGFLAFLSGSFMRGDQEALEGFEHMMFAFNLVPLGSYVSGFLSGEFTIMKLTAIHVGATTFAILVIGVVHILMRKVYVHVERRWKKALVYTAVLTAVLVVQSIFMEAPLVRGLEAGPTITGMEITKPPWPIYFMIGAENVFGATAMIYSTLIFIPLVILPYVLDWLPLSKIKKFEVGEALYYGGIFLIIALSFWAASGEIVAHIFM